MFAKYLVVTARNFLCCLAVFSAIILNGTIARAQDASATVNGVVSDPSGAAVPNAQVSLTNVATTVTRNTTANTDGAYAFLNVLPGEYAAHASAPGFSAVTQSNITLQVNQTATLDFHLKVGDTQTTVTVEASGATVEASTAELGTVVNHREVVELPLNGRNFTQLLTITPGVANVHMDQSSGGGGGFVGNALGSFSFPAINGARVRSNTFLLDGVNNLNTFLTTYNFEPIVDDIQEFKTQGHNDLAEYGGVTGGIISVVSKSGTNAYHGTLWEFLRNEQMDARGFFQANRVPLRQNVFGAAAGGPVWIPKIYNGKNRSFFYAAYEGYRQRLFNETGALAATDAMRNGDFSGLVDASGKQIPIYDPNTSKFDPTTNSYTRTQFPGNVIPKNELNPIALAYQNLIPHAGALVNGNNLFVPQRSSTTQDSGSVRGDQYVGNSDQMMFRFSKYYQLLDTPSGVIATQNSAIYGYNLAAHETHTFGPTAILDVYFGRNFGNNEQSFAVPGETSAFINSVVGMGIAPAFSNLQGTTYAPSMLINGYVGYPYSHIQNTSLANVWQWGGTFSKIVGKHTLKFGVDFQTNNFHSPIVNSNEGFSATQTAGLGVNQGVGGNAYASFLAGDPANAVLRVVNEVNHGGWANAFFVQDQWKVSSKLTVNLGVRYDVKLWPIYGTGKDLYTGDADAVTGQYFLTALPPNCSASVGAPCIPNGNFTSNGSLDPYNGLPPHALVTPNSNHAIINNDYSNWAGRLGLAYRLRDKTVLRAGYGRFYDVWGAVTQLAQNFGGNWPAVQTISNNVLNQNIQTAPITDPLGLGSGGGIVYPPSDFSKVSQWMVDPHFKTPYMDQWNFGVQQQMPGSAVLDVNYVGSVGRHLDWGPEQNVAVTPGPGNYQQRQPFPYMLPQWFDQSVGNSRYDALQVSYNKRTTHNLAFLVSYTLSRASDSGCSADIGANCDVQNVYNRAGDVGVSAYDETHVFSASFTAKSPFGQNGFITNKFVAGVVGGWLLNGIIQLHSGLPYSVVTSNSIPNVCGCNQERANLVGNPNSGNLGVNTTWFNTAAFVNPAPYTFGNGPRNGYRGDWGRNVDLSLFRQFHVGLGESRFFEFRAEAFNVFNNVVFNNPDGNMTDSNFGRVTGQQNGPRELQLGLKFYF